MSRSATPADNGTVPTIRPTLDAPAIALLMVMCTFLAVGQVAIKLANAGISPIFQAGLRSAAAACIVAVWMRLSGRPMFGRDRIFGPVLLAAAFFSAEFAFLYPGLERTTAVHAIILLYTAPFVVAVGSHIFIPADPMTRSKLGGLLIAMAGIAVVMFGRDLKAGVAGPTLEGDLLCLAGGIAWGLFTVTIRATRLATVAPERVNFLTLLASAPMLGALALMLGEPGFTNPTNLVWFSFAFTVIFIAFFVYTVTNWLFMRYSASRVMAFLMVTPAFGVLAGHLLLGEALGPSVLGGLALLIIGLALLNWAPGTPPAKRDA
jgi:drug/metabolite transporter (DMT)-like permease